MIAYYAQDAGQNHSMAKSFENVYVKIHSRANYEYVVSEEG
jgi:hypothetical protein